VKPLNYDVHTLGLWFQNNYNQNSICIQRTNNIEFNSLIVFLQRRSVGHSRLSCN